MTRSRRRWSCLVLQVLALSLARGEGPPHRAGELAELQDQILGDLTGLDKRIVDLIERLRSLQAEDAKRLEKAKEELAKRNVLLDMGEVRRRLENGSLTGAIEVQEVVIKNLEAIIAELEGRRYDLEDHSREIEALRKAIQDVAGLIREEEGLKEKTEGLLGTAGGLKGIQDARSRVQALRDAQDEVRRGAPPGPDDKESTARSVLERIDGMIAAQEDLAGKCRSLESSPPSGDAQGSRQELAEAQSGLAKGASGAAVDAAREASRARSESGDGKADGSGAWSDASKALQEAAKAMAGASDSIRGGTSSRGSQEQSLSSLKEARGKVAGELARLEGRSPLERKLGEQERIRREAEGLQRKLGDLAKQVGGAQGGVSESSDLVGQAAGHMRRAEGALSSKGNAAGAQGNAAGAQGDASKALSRADEALAQAERSQAERMKRQAPEGIAGEQDRLERMTREVAEKLRRSTEARQSMEGAAQGLDRAGSRMGAASRNLRQTPQGGSGSVRDAVEEQEKALEELEQVQGDLARRERQLENLQAEREIVSVIEKLRTSRAEQMKINEETLAIEQRRRAERRIGRTDRIRLRDLAEGQGKLGQGMGEVAEILERDRAHVFSFVTKDIRGDMDQIRQALAEEETGSFTQLLQSDVVGRIDKLMKALEHELNRRQKETPPSEQEGQELGKPRLIPPVAELIMLRGMQDDVNQRTRDIDGARQVNEGKLNPIMERMLDRLTMKQGEIAEITRKIAEDLHDHMGTERPGEEGETQGEGPQREEGRP